MTDNQAKGMLGIWSLTPGQVVEANKSPLPPESGRWLMDDGTQQVALESDGDREVYEGDRVSLDESGDGYSLRIGGDEQHLDEDELREELLNMVEYVPSMDDIVDSMERFEEAREGGTGAIAMERAATIAIDGVEISVSNDRMWDEATYQAAMTPITLFQDVYEHRPDQHDDLEELYGTDVVERATNVGA